MQLNSNIEFIKIFEFQSYLFRFYVSFCYVTLKMCKLNYYHDQYDKFTLKYIKIDINKKPK